MTSTDKAMGNLGYARNDADFYPTPHWCTQALVEAVAGIRWLEFCSHQTAWEPANGEGDIAAVLSKRVRSVFKSDLHDYGTGATLFDFMSSSSFPPTLDVLAFDHIVTNPPYDIAPAFVLRALEYMWSRRATNVFMLMRNEWDCAKTRNDFFQPEQGFAAQITLTSRPKWIAGSTGSPRHNYAWFVWSRHVMDKTMGAPAYPIKLYAHKA